MRSLRGFSGLPRSTGEQAYLTHDSDRNIKYMALKRGFLIVGGGKKHSALSELGRDHGLLPTFGLSSDNLVEGKRKRRSNISSPATPTASSSSSTTPTRKTTESPRASTGVPSGKRKLITSEEERSPAKRGRKSATVKPGEMGFLYMDVLSVVVRLASTSLQVILVEARSCPLFRAQQFRQEGKYGSLSRLKMGEIPLVLRSCPPPVPSASWDCFHSLVPTQAFSITYRKVVLQPESPLSPAHPLPVTPIQCGENSANCLSSAVT